MQLPARSRAIPLRRSSPTPLPSALEAVEKSSEGAAQGAEITNLLLCYRLLELPESVAQLFTVLAATFLIQPLGASDQKPVLGLIARMHLDVRQRREPPLQVSLRQARRLSEAPCLLHPSRHDCRLNLERTIDIVCEAHRRALRSRLVGGDPKLERSQQDVVFRPQVFALIDLEFDLLLAVLDCIEVLGSADWHHGVPFDDRLDMDAVERCDVIDGGDAERVD